MGKRTHRQQTVGLSVYSKPTTSQQQALTADLSSHNGPVEYYIKGDRHIYVCPCLWNITHGHFMGNHTLPNPDTAKLIGPRTLADKRWVGPVKLLCIMMSHISKIRPKSILGPVKAQKFSRCLLTCPHLCIITIFLAATKQLNEWYFLSVCLSVCHTFLTMFPLSYHHEIFRSYH